MITFEFGQASFAELADLNAETMFGVVDVIPINAGSKAESSPSSFSWSMLQAGQSMTFTSCPSFFRTAAR